MDDARSRTRESYDRIAGAYADALFNELDGKPLDRELLRDLVARVTANGEGPICDLGCGPGQIARFMADAGAPNVCGVDLSPGMIELARERSPDLDFQVCDAADLPFSDGSLAGIAAFYSIVHFKVSELVPIFAEAARATRVGGFLLVAFHVGDHLLHRDELFDQAVDLGFRFFAVEAVEAALVAGGWDLIRRSVREPYADKEHPSTRAYLLVQRRP
jgi:SAM-dependent methyltransferase